MQALETDTSNIQSSYPLAPLPAVMVNSAYSRVFGSGVPVTLAFYWPGRDMLGPVRETVIDDWRRAAASSRSRQRSPLSKRNPLGGPGLWIIRAASASLIPGACRAIRLPSQVISAGCFGCGKPHLGTRRSRRHLGPPDSLIMTASPGALDAAVCLDLSPKRAWLVEGGSVMLLPARS